MSYGWVIIKSPNLSKIPQVTAQENTKITSCLFQQWVWNAVPQSLGRCKTFLVKKYFDKCSGLVDLLHLMCFLSYKAEKMPIISKLHFFSFQKGQNAALLSLRSLQKSILLVWPYSSCNCTFLQNDISTWSSSVHLLNHFIFPGLKNELLKLHECSRISMVMETSMEVTLCPMIGLEIMLIAVLQLALKKNIFLHLRSYDSMWLNSVTIKFIQEMNPSLYWKVKLTISTIMRKTCLSCSITLVSFFQWSLKSVENSCQIEKKVLGDTSFSPSLGFTIK